MSLSGMQPLPPQPHERTNVSQSEHAQAFKDEIAEYGDAAKSQSPTSAGAAIDRVTASAQANIDDTNRKTRNDETRAVNRFFEQTETGKRNIDLAKDGADHHSVNERLIDKIRNSPRGSETVQQTTVSTSQPAMNDANADVAASVKADQQSSVDKMKATANDLQQKAADTTTALKNKASAAASDMKNRTNDAANEVSDTMRQKYDETSTKAKQTKEQLSAKMQSAKETTMDKLHQARQSVDEFAQQAKANTSAALTHAQQTASDTADALRERSAQTSATVTQAANDMSAAAKEQYEQTKQSLAEGAQQLSDGLRQRYDAAKAYISDTAASAEHRLQSKTPADSAPPRSSEKSEDGSFKDISYETTQTNPPLPMTTETQTTQTRYVDDFGPKHGAVATAFASHAVGAAETIHGEPAGLGSAPGINTGSLPPVDPMFDAGAKLGYATEQMNAM